MTSRRPPGGMPLDTFLDRNYEWAQEPHLYIVLQIPQLLTNPAYRCGAAGTALYQDADQPFRASDSSQKGLQGRMTQYNNYFLPNVGRIFACLRVRKQLVALPNQRVAGDEDAPYNVDRGNQTDVLAKEKHFHYYLDQLGLRWRKETNKELFVPNTGSVMQLVDALRKVQGLQLLLFDKNDWREDSAYDGGETPPVNLQTVETTRRTSAVAQANKERSLIIKLSKSGIDQLRAGNPMAYASLMKLMREAFAEQTGKPVAPPAPAPKPTPIQIVDTPVPSPVPSPVSPATTVATLPTHTITALRDGGADEDVADAIDVITRAVVGPPVTRSRARAAAVEPRRSVRLAGRR